MYKLILGVIVTALLTVFTYLMFITIGAVSIALNMMSYL